MEQALPKQVMNNNSGDSQRTEKEEILLSKTPSITCVISLLLAGGKVRPVLETLADHF